MWYSISNLVFLFFIYSFIGWLWETVYCSLKDKQFVYRGFLAGPYCPVYGFAVTTVLFLTKPFQENLPILFFGGLIIATVFEYMAACFLEKVFHMKLWDYSQESGNIKGRIAPLISLFWGIGVVFLVKLIQPSVMQLLAKVNAWWALGIALFMTADFIWTVSDLASFQRAALSLERKMSAEGKDIQAYLREIWGNLEEETDFFYLSLRQFHLQIEKMFREKGIQPFRFHQRRMLRNYHKLKLKDAPFVTVVHKQLASVKNRDFKKR